MKPENEDEQKSETRATIAVSLWFGIVFFLGFLNMIGAIDLRAIKW